MSVVFSNMIKGKLKFILVILITSSFRFASEEIGGIEVDNDFSESLFGYKHKEFYKTDEIKYVCYERILNESKSSRLIGWHQNYKYKRIYYDRCGNIKLVIKGKREVGCWVNDFKILTSKRKNELISCTKEEFKYPTDQEMKED